MTIPLLLSLPIFSNLPFTGLIFLVIFKIFSNDILLFIAAIIAISKFLICTLPINFVEKEYFLLLNLNITFCSSFKN